MKNLFVTFLAVAVFCSCSTDPERIFKGKLNIVEKPTIDTLVGKKISFDSLYTGSLRVHDSIISFLSHKYVDYHAASFDVRTGEHIGNFFKKGQGPGEFTEFSPRHPDIDHDYWITEFNKRHYVLVDLASGQEKKRIDLSWVSQPVNQPGAPFIRTFILNDSLILAINRPEPKNLGTDIAVPKFRLINYLSKKDDVAYYDLFDEKLYNKLQGNERENTHLEGTSHIKPDKSKVVHVMTHLYQVSILDLKTGELNGYRLAGTPGFEFVRTPMPPWAEDVIYTYHYWASVDNRFIYLMLSNDSSAEAPAVFHVFDWEGNFIRILETGQNAITFEFDSAQKKIYTNDAEENVWVYDVSYLYQ